ncbi:hypothetical protein MPH_02532 [Macrophomina phaseolina MS6]|uniref:Uncharacterized protein n=1 Tax=Macrophomina phaseolina (strain MS6) TaxID=1126212 RepID=K2STX0_MACPH|nr:hypothetical protein MPH_02532 [Macrophomina phaseolina MS6]
MLTTTFTSSRRDIPFDVDPVSYTRIMHAHTRAQLAAATSPPAVSASPSAQLTMPVAAAKVTSPNSIPAVAPPEVSDSPIASKETTIVKEPSPKSGTSSMSSGYSGGEEKSPVYFDAGKLHIPAKVRSSPAGSAGGLVSGDARREHGEVREARRRSDGGLVGTVYGGEWESKENGMKAIQERGGEGGEEKERRGSADSTRHASTRLRCTVVEA